MTVFKYVTSTLSCPICTIREEARLTAKLRGEDGPLITKCYSDTHTRFLRGGGGGGGRHHRAASFPLPAILGKLPPSIASFSSPGTHEAFQVGDGLNLCLLLLPDGSGYCKWVWLYFTCTVLLQ